MHLEYEAAKRRFEEVYGCAIWIDGYMWDRWAEALAKDPTGAQCVRMVEDLEEQNREMKE